MVVIACFKHTDMYMCDPAYTHMYVCDPAYMCTHTCTVQYIPTQMCLLFWFQIVIFNLHNIPHTCHVLLPPLSPASECKVRHSRFRFQQGGTEAAAAAATAAAAGGIQRYLQPSGLHDECQARVKGFHSHQGFEVS